MSSPFQYLIEKIKKSSFSNDPFRHIEISDFLSPEHFHFIANDPQISLEKANDTAGLLKILDSSGYKVIPFPGCVTSTREYLDWIDHGYSRKIHDATEGFGIVYRLVNCRSALIEEFNRFLVSPEFQAAMVEKFGITTPVQIDTGIQKYLHGYEISPHPDIRRKALTWMLNINTGDFSEDQEFHTHYLRLKPEWSFITAFWQGNPQIDRDWLPWSWCETVKRQRQNNSLVIFAPSDDTIHAVKASYDHLGMQRTQMYGNLWHPARRLPKVEYSQFTISGEAYRRHEQASAREKVVRAIMGRPLGRSLLGLRNMLRPRHVDTVRQVDV